MLLEEQVCLLLPKFIHLLLIERYHLLLYGCIKVGHYYTVSLLGDIAFRFLDSVKRNHGGVGQAQVTVLDINPAMLQVGRERALKLGYPVDCKYQQNILLKMDP